MTGFQAVGLEREHIMSSAQTQQVQSGGLADLSASASAAQADLAVLCEGGARAGAELCEAVHPGCLLGAAALGLPPHPLGLLDHLHGILLCVLSSMYGPLGRAQSA